MKYEIDGIYYDIVLERKKIKNLYIRFKDNIIYINSPFLILEKEIYKVLDKNITSLKKMVEKDKRRKELTYLGEKIDIVVVSNLRKPYYSNGKLYVKNKNKIDEAYKIIALPIFKERLDYIYKRFEESIPYPILKLRKMSSRWGVCNRKNNSVTLNTELIKWGVDFIDYVIVHELAHFVHFDHSASFWNVVSKYFPMYKEYRKKLRE